MNTSVSGPTVTTPIVMNGAAPPTVETPIAEGSSATTNALTPVAEPNAAAATPPASSSTQNDPPAAAATTSDPDPKPNNPTPEWAQKRINELTAKRYEAERTAVQEREKREAVEKLNAELLARVNPPAQSTTTTTTQPPAPTEEEIEKRAAAKAAEIAARNEFNRACNTIAENGKTQFKDWDTALDNLNLVGAVGKGAGPEFLQNAIELKSPEKVLHYLGTNLEQAERIVKLSPTKQAIELARIEAQLNTPAPPPPVSNAPAPVIPVGGAAKTGAPDISDPNLSMEDWVRLRAQQKEDHKKRYQR